MCQDRNCGYRRNLSKTTNARCPQCHKRMSLVGEGGRQTFSYVHAVIVKSCRHLMKEKKKPEAKYLNGDVAAYMRKQEKEAAASAGSALADALKKNKIDKNGEMEGYTMTKKKVVVQIREGIDVEHAKRAGNGIGKV